MIYIHLKDFLKNSENSYWNKGLLIKVNSRRILAAFMKEDRYKYLSVLNSERNVPIKKFTLKIK